ncbi:hypothetical protein [Spirillospora sp. NPDC029432]|uniref:hypothetical protein n=1 Tax=Spirillospora sp. NPDC029432 TaxID=3154599 RepID=UPI0034530837
MSEDLDAWNALHPKGILHGLGEAHREATLAVFGGLSRSAGFTDRSYGYSSFDVLASQIDRTFRGDPEIVRDNLNGSPGWRYGPYRILLKRHEFGAVRGIRWDRDSATKQMVARQDYADDPQLALDLGDLPGDPGDAAGTVTLVLAHSASEEPLELELFLGRPRHNADGGDPWFWLLRLDADALGPDPRRRAAEPTLPLWTGPEAGSEADVPMRLRTGSGSAESPATAPFTSIATNIEKAQ